MCAYVCVCVYIYIYTHKMKKKFYINIVSVAYPLA